MYDKNLLDIETQAILEHLSAKDNVLDIGCGEGEGTIKYFEKVNHLIALDYSLTRLEKLKEKNNRIKTIHMDMKELLPEHFDIKFDRIITQRSLINLKGFQEQKTVIEKIHDILKEDGKYIMLEGFCDGSEQMNMVRRDFEIPEIKVKWHNCFFNKEELLDNISPFFTLEYSRDFSLYFFITRVFNAILRHPEIPAWNDNINNLARKMELTYKNRFIKGISRLELLVFKKNQEDNKRKQ